MSLDPTGKGQVRGTMRWKTALNAFDITFDGRLSANPQQAELCRTFEEPLICPQTDTWHGSIATVKGR